MNYYNEWDKNAAAWLRALMEEGLIPKGEVDERSIVDVAAGDVRGFTQVHFFAGIGGWSYALRLAGWPEGEKVWTASCPCQPFSPAGRNEGVLDQRHLWPAVQLLIAQCNPPTIFGEQVASEAGRLWLAGIRAELEGMGYAVGAADLCSAGVGAPNIRQRLYWAAESKTEQQHREMQSRGRWSGSPDHGSNGGGVEHPTGDGWQQRGTDSSERGIVGGCGAGGMADATRAARARQRSEQEHVPGTAGEWLGEPNHKRLEGHPGNGYDGREPGRVGEEPAGSTSQAGAHSGVGEPTSDRNGQAQEPAIHSESEGEGRQCVSGGSVSSSFWSTAVWHPCSDGKQRRIPAEPVLQRMADGFPDDLDIVRAASGFPLSPRLKGRVALLAGYGNAINPQIAAEFVKAYMETL